MEEKSWERRTFLKEVFLQNEEVCTRVSIYKDLKNLHLSEYLLKPKTLCLDRYYSYAVLHLFPNSV